LSSKRELNLISKGLGAILEYLPSSAVRISVCVEREWRLLIMG
jgi:hypothetical protein